MNCNNKKQYTKKDAETIKNLRRKEGVLLRIYPCPFGNHFHLTKKDAHR